MKKQEILELIESWENLALFINEAGKTPENFDMLMDIALNSTDKKSWRAAWLADKIHDEYPLLILPYIETLILKLHTLEDQGKRRHFLKLLSMNELPEKYYGFLVDYCFTVLSSEEPASVRVHAMQVLYNISEKEPGLKPELALAIEQEIEYRPTPGIISRGKRLLKKLRKEVR